MKSVIHCTRTAQILIIICLAIFSSIALGQASASYNQNSVPVTGDACAAFGFGSLINNTSGEYNTAVGYNSLNSNSTGSNNTAIGPRVLYSNSIGVDNTCIGSHVMSINVI